MLSKSGIIFTTMVFYAMIIFMLSFNIQGTEGMGTQQDYGEAAGISFGNIITNITSLGWLNAVLFAPLTIIFFWVVGTSLVPTINSGS